MSAETDATPNVVANGDAGAASPKKEKKSTKDTAKEAVVSRKKVDPQTADVLKKAMNYATGRKGMEMEQAMFSDEHGQLQGRVEVFRASDLVDKLMDSPLGDEKNEFFCIESRDDAYNLCCRMLHEGGFFHTADRVEKGDRVLVNQTVGRSFRDQQDFFCVNIYEGSKGLRFFAGVGILVVFFLGCLFPVWPMAMKLAVRDGSRYLLLVLVGMLMPLTVIRPIMAGLTGWWFLPNLWAENPADSIYEELMGSFRPVWQPPCKSRESSWETVKTVLITIVVLVVVYFLVVIDISEKEDTGEKFDDQDFEKLLNKEDVAGSIPTDNAPPSTGADPAGTPAGVLEEEEPEVDDDELDRIAEEQDLMKELLREKRAEEIKYEMSKEGKRKKREEDKNRKKGGFSSRKQKKG